ncbi:MAG: hypothetical protein PUC23_01805 [bacterium]|nr:hypothetical protein [bacterium]
MHNVDNVCDNDRRDRNNGSFGLLIVVVLYILLAIIFSSYTYY